MVPNGWLKTDLKDYIEIKHGFAFKSEHFRDSGDYILLTPGSFYEVGGYRDQGAKTKYYVGEIPDSYLLSKGELLVAMTEQAAGLLGSTLFVPESNVYLHNQRLGKIVIEAHEQIAKEFLYLTFNAPYARKQISSQSTGTKVKHTSPDKLKSVVCLLPPIDEQRKIAKILSTWDKAISTTERLIDNSKQQKKALMQQLLTGKKRLLDDSGKPFEGEWQRKLFKEILRLDRGSSPRPIVNFITEDSDGVNWIKIGDTKNDTSYITSTKEKISLEGAKKSRRVSSGEIIVSNSMSYGKPYILKINGYIHDGWFVLRDYQEHIDSTFLIQLLSSEFVQAQYKRLAAGGVVTNISSELVYVVKVNLPQISEQRKIAAVLSNADKEIVLFEKQLADLKQEKKALMQQLLTGKRRVKPEIKEDL